MRAADLARNVEFQRARGLLLTCPVCQRRVEVVWGYWTQHTDPASRRPGRPDAQCDTSYRLLAPDFFALLSEAQRDAALAFTGSDYVGGKEHRLNAKAFGSAISTTPPAPRKTTAMESHNHSEGEDQ